MGEERITEYLNVKLKGLCAGGGPGGGWAQRSVDDVTLKEGHCAPCKAADVVVVSEGERCCHCATLSVKVEREALGPPKIVRQTWLSDDPTCCISCVGGCV